MPRLKPRRNAMERKALNSLGYMELVAFFIFVVGVYFDLTWLQTAMAVCFVGPVAGILRYPARCKSTGEPFVKARFAWSVITLFLYLGMAFGVLSLF